MAKRGKRGRPKKKESVLEKVSEESKRTVITLFVLLLAIFFVLSLFDLGGNIGLMVHHFVIRLLGWGQYVLPIGLLILAYFLIRRSRYQLNVINYFGFMLFMVSILGFFHLLIPQEQYFDAVEVGTGGGYIGLLISVPLAQLVGVLAGLLISGGLCLIGFVLFFNGFLMHAGWMINRLVGFVFWPVIQLMGIFKRKESSVDLGKDMEEPEEEEKEEPVKEIIEAKQPIEAPAFKAKQVITISDEVPTVMAEAPKRKKFKKVELPLTLLDEKSGKPMSGNVKQSMAIIKKTLEQFRIPVTMGDVSVGPTVTQYTLKPQEGVRLSRIIALVDDLSLALAAHPIRIEAPIPGKSLVGIEVPNQTVAIVSLKEILTSEAFAKRKTNLTIALGKDVAGGIWVADIASMPHMLVAGATGSGKSVCLNTMLVSLLYQNSPEDLKFILIDPKRVELTMYDGLPYLIAPVVTDIKKTVNSLKWCMAEMDRRYTLLQKHKRVNIKDFNASAKEKLPYIVVVIDELADIMVTAGREVEPLIIRLAQMARAVGIHLILATQRPSVDVLTGLIKANITSRIAFAVASGMDSRTILDTVGAEKLVGRGDMLYNTASIGKPVRLQGSYVSDVEIRKVVNHLKKEYGEPEYHEEITEKQSGQTSFDYDKNESGDEDDLYEEAKSVVMKDQKASISLLQRRLKVGFSRAGRLMDMLEENGVIGPGVGAKPREVYLTKEEAIPEQVVIHAEEPVEPSSEPMPQPPEEPEESDKESV